MLSLLWLNSYTQATFLKNENFSFSTELTPRPFKWAQRIAGIDIMSERLTGRTISMDPAVTKKDADDGTADTSGNALIGNDAIRTFREGRAVQLIKALYASSKSHKVA